jgi:hypothetical protein
MTFDEEDEDAFRHILSIPQGRRVLLWVLKQCPVYSTSWSDQTGTVSAFAEGNRNVGLKLIRALGIIDPTAYPKLLIEFALEEQHRLATEKQEQDDGEPSDT